MLDGGRAEEGHDSPRKWLLLWSAFSRRLHPADRVITRALAPSRGRRRASLPPESGPPPFPGGTRTFPPTRASRSAGEVSLTHLGVAPRTFRGVEAARPTPHRSSSGTPLLRGGFRLFDEHLLRDSPRYHAAVLGLSQFRHISWRSCLTEARSAMIPRLNAATCSDALEVGFSRRRKACLLRGRKPLEHPRRLAPR